MGFLFPPWLHPWPGGNAIHTSKEVGGAGGRGRPVSQNTRFCHQGTGAPVVGGPQPPLSDHNELISTPAVWPSGKASLTDTFMAQIDPLSPKMESGGSR